MIRLDDDLGVAFGKEPVAEIAQFGFQLAVIVDTAVKDQAQAQLIVDHGLLGGRCQVEDAQSPMSERDCTLCKDSSRIRPPGVH